MLEKTLAWLFLRLPEKTTRLVIFKAADNTSLVIFKAIRKTLDWLFF
jgi:hypothetical protein